MYIVSLTRTASFEHIAAPFTGAARRLPVAHARAGVTRDDIIEPTPTMTADTPSSC